MMECQATNRETTGGAGVAQPLWQHVLAIGSAG